MQPTTHETTGAKAPIASSETLLAVIQASLEDDKAEEIVTIDLQGKTSIADYMVIANGRSARQVAAIADHLLEKVRAHGGPGATMEGKAQGDWVLIDAGDVIAHVFRSEVRTFYNLEKMWSVDLSESSLAV